MEVCPLVLSFGSTTQLAGQQRVLIVDRSDDNREVLKTVLQRQGVQILEAAGAEDGLRLARQCRPDVVVLDLDTVDADDRSLCDAFNDRLRAKETALVLLGTIPAETSLLPARETIAKPYHYRPLIRKIEALLQHAEQPRQQRETPDP